MAKCQSTTTPTFDRRLDALSVISTALGHNSLLIALGDKVQYDINGLKTAHRKGNGRISHGNYTRLRT